MDVIVVQVERGQAVQTFEVTPAQLAKLVVIQSQVVKAVHT